jgi:hypothetical protein
VPIEELITTKEYAYKVTKVLVSKYRVLEEFIIDYNKLFTSKY